MTAIKQINYFKTFGLTEKYSIDQNDLLKKYHQLQKLYHPDNKEFTVNDKSINKQIEDNTYIEHINLGYNILKNNEKRLAYLLSLKGYSSDGISAVPPELLMEIMEINEQLEDSKRNKNKITTDRIINNVKIKLNSLLETSGKEFDDNNIDKSAVLFAEFNFYKRTFSLARQ